MSGSKLSKTLALRHAKLYLYFRRLQKTQLPVRQEDLTSISDICTRFCTFCTRTGSWTNCITRFVSSGDIIWKMYFQLARWIVCYINMVCYSRKLFFNKYVIKCAEATVLSQNKMKIELWATKFIRNIFFQMLCLQEEPCLHVFGVSGMNFDIYPGFPAQLFFFKDGRCIKSTLF